MSTTPSSNLSRYVFHDPTRSVYFNSMTKQTLSDSSSETELRDNLFLAGQESASLESRLFKKPTELQLRVIPTWECNLRCRHCSVLEQLKNDDPCLINPDQVVNFIRTHIDTYQTETVGICFIGGEAMLETKFCLNLLRRIKTEFPNQNLFSTMTTNLAFELSEDAVLFLNMLDKFCVSLDGDEEQHNWQRKTKENVNIYQRTYTNLKRLSMLGIAKKIRVQAAIQQEKFSIEAKARFYKDLLSIGIEDIDYGCVHPTKQKKEADQFYLNVLQSPKLYDIPCCDYRFMNHFLVNSNNNLYRSYYSPDYKTFLGSLSKFDQPNPEYMLGFIESLYKAGIRQDMAIFQDQTCLNSCPVLAYCWGRCVNNDLFTKKQPSKYCDQAAVVAEATRLAESGDLVELYQ